MCEWRNRRNMKKKREELKERKGNVGECERGEDS